MSVPGFDDLRSSRELPAVKRSSEIEVDTHFTDMESGEISIIVDEAEDSKKPPVMLLSALLVGILVLGIGVFFMQSRGGSDSELKAVDVSEVPTEASGGKNLAQEEQVAEVQAEAPEKVPGDVAELEAAPVPIAEPTPTPTPTPTPEPVRTQGSVAAKANPIPSAKVSAPTKVAAQPAVQPDPLEPEPEPEPAVAKPAEKTQKTKPAADVSVDTFAIEPKKDKGLLKVEPSSKGGLLPIGQ